LAGERARQISGMINPGVRLLAASDITTPTAMMTR
jgi:hypothetical protein